MGKIISRLPPPQRLRLRLLKNPFRFIGGAPPFPSFVSFAASCCFRFPGRGRVPISPPLSLATTNLSYLGRDQFLREILSREREV